MQWENGMSLADSAQRCLVRTLAAVALSIASGGLAPATEWFVDNRDGDDINDGLSVQSANDKSGPVRTISRALKRVHAGDVIHIANHGAPYYESLEIVGPRFRGGLVIDGNNAVVSGAIAVPPNAWKLVGEGVWRFAPRRKAFYQLILGQRALPEQPCPAGAATLPELLPGRWCAWRGSIYFRVPDARQSPGDLPLAFAGEEVGITLLDAQDVVIHNLELRHFRLDGVNAHDRCKDIILDAVRLIENGRAGLAVCGTSLVGLKDSTLEGNRLVQVLNTELAQTELVSCQLGPAPWGPIRVLGGHVLVEGEEAK